MNKGYQIFEHRAINSLLSNPAYDVFAVAVLSWICGHLQIELKEHLQCVEFDVICVNYHGNYPAIGIHYKREGYQDMAPVVDATVTRLLEEKSVKSLFEFVVEKRTDWKKVTSELLGENG